MKKTKIINWNNYKPSEGEFNSGELKTVPDQAFTVREILEKYTRGLSLDDLYRDHQYDEDDITFDDIDPKDLAKDPYDIDEDIVSSSKFRGKKKALKEVDELPEDGGLQTTPKDEGVKDT